MAYEISGTSNDNSRIYVLQDGSLKGYKNNNYGNYNIVFDSDTPSGISVMAETPDGQVAGYGGLVAVGTASSPNLDAGGGISIASIQSGSVSGNNTATITEVDMSKSILFNNGANTSKGSGSFSWYIRLQDSTTVYCKASGTSTISFSVLEFSSGIKSIQRGVAHPEWAGVPFDVAISSVDTANSIVNYCGVYANQGTPNKENGRLYLLNSTTLRLDHYVSTDMEVSWEVIEFE